MSAPQVDSRASRLFRALALAASLARGQRTALVSGVAIGVVGRLATLAIPLGLRQLLASPAERHAITVAAITLAAGGVVHAAAEASGGRVLRGAAERMAGSLLVRIEAHALDLPLAWFERRHVAGTSALLLHELTGVGGAIVGALSAATAALVVAATALPVAIRIDPALTAMASLAIVAAGVGLALGVLARRAHAGDVSDAYTALAGRLSEQVAGIRVVKTHGAERQESGAYAGLVARSMAVNEASARAGAFARSAGSLFAALAGAGVVWLGSARVAGGTLAAGDLLALAAAFALVSGPVLGLVALAPEAARVLGALDHAAVALALPRDRAGENGAIAAPAAAPTIELRDVRFGYVPERPVLRGVSLVARAGITTAIVGASGEGKSTLLDLVAGLRRPDAGEILVDGVDLARISAASWRARLGVVDQHPVLFDRPARDNVAYGRDDLDEAVAAACGTVGVLDVILALEGGFSAPLGEGGLRLSGGERQRLTVARAIVRRPAVLLLDEPTSHLDPAAERELHVALAATAASRTTVIVSHRAAVVRRADWIVVLAAGRVAEQGTHDDLLARGGAYAALFGGA